MGSNIKQNWALTSFTGAKPSLYLQKQRIYTRALTIYFFEITDLDTYVQLINMYSRKQGMLLLN